MINYSKIRLVFSVFALMIFFAPLSAKAVGISPPVIDVRNVLRGVPYAVKVTIFNDQNVKNQDFYVSVKPRGEYAHYINAPTEFFVPADKASADFLFYIDAKDASVGSYNVYLDFLSKSKPTANSAGVNGGNSSNVSIVQGASLTLNFTVSGEEKLEYQLISAQMSDSEIGLPLNVRYVIQNTGNVDWKPNKIKLSIAEKSDKSKKAEIEILEKDIQLIHPGELKESRIDVAHSLLTGNYKALLTFYDNKDRTVGELSTQRFTIYPTGSLKQSGEFVDFTTLKNKYKQGEKIKLSALFKNTGDMNLSGILVTEIYKNDELLDILRSKEMAVDRNTESEFSLITDFNNLGKYKFSAYIEYGAKKTSLKTVNIEVVGKELSQIEIVFIFGGLIVALFVIILIYKLIKKRQAYDMD